MGTAIHRSPNYLQLEPESFSFSLYDCISYIRNDHSKTSFYTRFLFHLSNHYFLS